MSGSNASLDLMFRVSPRIRPEAAPPSGPRSVGVGPQHREPLLDDQCCVSSCTTTYFGKRRELHSVPDRVRAQSGTPSGIGLTARVAADGALRCQWICGSGGLSAARPV